MRLQGSLAQGDAAAVAEIVQRLETAHAQKPTLENSNDLGVARLLTGKIDAAIALFRETKRSFRVTRALPRTWARPSSSRAKMKKRAIGFAKACCGTRASMKAPNGSMCASSTRSSRSRRIRAGSQRTRVLSLDFGSGDVPVAPEILPIEKGKLKGGEDLLRQITYQLRRAHEIREAAGRDRRRSLRVRRVISRFSGPETSSATARKGESSPRDCVGIRRAARETGARAASQLQGRYRCLAAAKPKPKKAAEEVVEYPSATESLESSARLFWFFVVGEFTLAIGGIVVHMLRRRRIGG